MKFIAYNVRPDERKYFENWSAKQDIPVKLIADEVKSDNLALAKGYDAVISFQTGTYPADFFDKLAEFGVKDVSIRNVGVDNLNLTAAKKYGIAVTNVPAYSPNAIAEFSITVLLQLLRQQNIFRKRMAENDYRWAPFVGKEIRALTIGIVGTGRIGKAAIEIYKGFGAKILAYDPYHDPKLESEGIYVDSLEELCGQVDVLTLHMPGSDKDGHLIDEAMIANLKDGAYIINTARGSLIDAKALLAALKSGKLGGAALDTYEYETPIFNHDLKQTGVKDELFNELVALDNVIMTPHIAFYTETAVENMVNISLDSAKDVIMTGKADTLVDLG
ncbi:D-2-hydroxyacid dehydrogenase [Ligilactobacillus apodemi]|uniref:D-lactate dehydrogenase n=1 Tax=Ligilactobacillus apodemi DSM 16634 = JCM 16172 TaxID=1423724 RepID=A0A0R1TYW0_9LACO|nr:D-2-hydroxyacid dehydrogenase [Ligilactobacillus apodemi]KRL83781.1 D-lactate dehydrogenase [Ligilactobacillus apodemi DSM 16634 = JCM 16172]MCR1900638.1 D-2-hydroxyacid dehydrogenase [Ligilactobacillus apodemi]